MTEKNPLPFESPSPLEQELHHLTPTPPSQNLDLNLATALQGTTTPLEPVHPYSFADRFLLTTCSAGLAAACLILTLLTLDFATPHPAAPAPSNLISASLSPTTDDPQRLLAQLMNDLPIPNSTLHPITRPN